MEEDKRKKVVDLISNKAFSIALNSNLPPPTRLRQIAFLMDTYADELLKDYILQLQKRYPGIETKVNE
jgi:hypothetical protein